MNTLYELLEVSENASKEVIEKAYKVLAKRYHPDLQTPENKQKAEQKMKQINEAYDILSDDTRRKAYDEELRNKREIEKPQVKDNYSNVNMQHTNYNQGNINTDEEKDYINRQDISKEEQLYRQMQRKKYEEDLLKQKEQMQKNMQEQYENAYYNYLRSLGYHIKERWTWEKTKKLLLALLIMASILLGLWFFPPTHNIMLNIYESNSLIKVLVDIILGIFVAFFEAIGSGFKSLFNGW